MPRESAREKGGRYLLEGRIIVTVVARNRVVAHARGEGALYRTTWTPADGWRCECPHAARSTYCSHVHAMRRITAVDLEDAHR